MSNESIDDSPRARNLFSRFISFATKNKMLLSVIVVLYLLPMTTGADLSAERDLLSVLTQIMILGILAMSFDFQLGRSGLLNFGHVALFGVGVYFSAFTLNSVVFEGLNIIPYPITLIIAMMIGAFLGFIMGLTTNRMRGTAFAFIALAIAMFLYNFFYENPVLSGGETGLRVATPAILLTAPFYLFFIGIAFIVVIAFFTMVILYVKDRTETVGLIFFTPVMLSLVGFLLLFGTNIFGAILVAGSLLLMIILYLMEKKTIIRDPLQVPMQSSVDNENSSNPLNRYILPLGIIALSVGAFIVAFGTNIGDMISLWFTGTDVFLYRIPTMYYLVLSCVVSIYLFTRRIIASPFGRMMTAVAQNEERAGALGYNSYLCKIVVVMISGAVAALSGALYAPFIRTIDPVTALGVEVSIDAMLYTIIGGLATLLGPLIGAGVVVYSELNLVHILESVGLPGETWLVGLGVIYVIIVLFLPLGIVGSVSVKSRSFRERIQRLQIGDIELGIKDKDYWVFALIGTLAVFLVLLYLTIAV